MTASHNLGPVAVMFDEDNLVPNAGLVAPALLAQRLNVAEVMDRRVRLDPGRPGAANSGAKALTMLGAMLAGGDAIENVDLLRAGAASTLFDDTRAPSTIGTWLRAFRRQRVVPLALSEADAALQGVVDKMSSTS